MTDSSEKKHVLAAKQRIADALAAFGQGNLASDAAKLLASLGYQSQRRIALAPPTGARFELVVVQGQAFNREKALWQEWDAVDVVFQLTDSEIRANAQIGMFESSQQFNGAIIESYLVLAVTLRGAAYSRSQLAEATRAINAVFAMPVLVVFHYGGLLTLSIVDRRINRRDQSRDTLMKVTLIKDIRLDAPHRAHLEILYDLSLDAIVETTVVRNFVELSAAWQRVLDNDVLNTRFFREISDWYFWAVSQVKFPEDSLDDIELDHENPTEQERRDKLYSMSVIRLLTRVIFIWFLRERGLVSVKLFQQTTVNRLLRDTNTNTYYKAVLQNLFFATLNQQMGQRAFCTDQNPSSTTLYHYQHLLADPDGLVALLKDVPFLNGGLFECLDKQNDVGAIEWVDGFSDDPDNPLNVPDQLFWAEEHKIDLNGVYGTKNKRYSVRGLINILSRYKFTIAENTPLEEEVALDPELLGKVFEHLLAAYNPETGDTARKQTGSFYTPRNVVRYMVDQSLMGYFRQELGANASTTAYLQRLFDQPVLDPMVDGRHPDLENAPETPRLISAIDRLAILDPACGSGAFPMGILSRLVELLAKVDPNNVEWKERQIAKANQIGDATIRDRALHDIEEAFERNDLDYGRKLYLIEHGIYGVDIQPIAVQIAKLRCYIALLVDQRIDDRRPNRGVRLLPNLETRFVAANSLFDVANEQIGLRSAKITKLEQELEGVRRRHFSANNPQDKQKYRDDDKKLRQEIYRLSQIEDIGTETIATLADWDPYNQNTVASFFNPEWMFGRVEDFDIVIGNPPYVRQEKFKHHKTRLRQYYKSYVGTADLYVYFFERAVRLLKPGGILCYIVSNKYFRSGYGEKLRQLLTEQTSMQQLLDFGDANIFTAIAYPSIIVTRKEPPEPTHTFEALNWEINTRLSEFEQVLQTQTFNMPQISLDTGGWRLEEANNLALLKTLQTVGTLLGQYVNKDIYTGVKTGLNEAFVIDRATKERLIAEDPASASVIKPFLRGRDVKRWSVSFAEQYLIKIPSSENERHPWSGLDDAKAEAVFKKTYSAIFAWMQPMRDNLIKRSDQGKYYWELRSCAYWPEFEKPKIIYPDIAVNTQFAFDTDNMYAGNTLYIIPTRQKWLLGILNSRIVFWIYQNISTQIRGGYVRFIAQYVSQIPIPQAAPSVQTLVERLVEYVLYISQLLQIAEQDQAGLAVTAPLAAIRSYFERIIDGIAYELYFPEMADPAPSIVALVQAAELPSFASLGADQLSNLTAIYQRLYEPQSALRRRIYFLDTHPIVRQIEAK